MKPGLLPCRGNFTGLSEVMEVRSSRAAGRLNSHQQLQLQLRQPPPLTAAVLPEDIVVILTEGMSVCGAGHVNKHLDSWNQRECLYLASCCLPDDGKVVLPQTKCELTVKTCLHGQQ